MFDMKVHCVCDTLVSISELRPHPKNRNKHSDDQIKRLAQILEYQGWRYPIKVSKRSGFITSGHGRLAAAKLMKWKEVPVNYQDYESDEQEYTDVQSDNAIASWAELDLAGINSDIGELGPDFDIDLLGIKDFVLEPAEKFEPQCDEDEIPEHVEPKSKLGDIYHLGRHRLLCGDSTQIDQVEKLMGGEKAELCFTSPPYADQRDYGGNLDLSVEHLATFIRASFNSCRYFAINLGYSRKDNEVNPFWDVYIKEAKSCRLKLLSWNVWDKGEAGSIGNNAAMFAIEHEWIFVFGSVTKDLNLTVPNKHAFEYNNHSGNREADGSITRGKPHRTREFSQLKTILHHSPLKARNHGINHPAMFPVEFPETYIEAMTNQNEIVYEPFGGSGSTLIACEKTNRKCVMMEIDPHYCDVIVARWEKYTGKTAELLNA